MSFDKDDQLERDGFYRREAIADIRADLLRLRSKVLNAMVGHDLGRELTAVHGALSCAVSDLDHQDASRPKET